MSNKMVLLTSVLLFIVLVNVPLANSELNNTIKYNLIMEIPGYGTGTIELASDGQMLAMVNANTLYIFTPFSDEPIFTFDFPNNSCGVITGNTCRFSLDGRLLASGLNSDLVVVDLDSLNILYSESYSIDHSIKSIGALAFTPNSQYLLIGGQHSGVNLLDLHSKKVVKSWNLGKSIAGLETVRGWQKCIIAYQHGGIIELWNWETGSSEELSSNCYSYCTGMGYTDRFLIASCGASTIRVWDITSRNFLGTIQGRRYIGQDFSSAPLRDWLIASSGPGSPNNPEGINTSEIIIYNLQNKDIIASWRAHDARGIYDISCSRDGSMIASCGYDRTLCFWEKEK